jgi:hypothetical protein
MDRMKSFTILITIASVLWIKPAFSQNHARFSDIKPCLTGGEEFMERALKIANERAVNLRCPETYTRAVILSCDWEMDYDGTGCVRARKLHMELYCEKPDGCGMAEFSFKQKYKGDGYFSDRLVFDRVGYMYDIDCEPSK